jgi:hypothetical protein
MVGKGKFNGQFNRQLVLYNFLILFFVIADARRSGSRNFCQPVSGVDGIDARTGTQTAAVGSPTGSAGLTGTPAASATPWFFRQYAGGVPNSRLNARLNAASDS